MFNIGISRDSHLLIVCTGAPRYNDFIAVIDLAADLVRLEGWTGLLVDLTALPPVFTADERAELGSHAGRMLAGRHVALVVGSEERFVVPQSAAAQGGGIVRYFTSHQQASRWLAEAAPGSP